MCSALSPADLAAAKRARLVDSDGRLTWAGRTLVGGDKPARESTAEFTMRWLRSRGPMNWNPRPPDYKEE